MAETTVGALLEDARARFAKARLGAAGFEARLIVGELTGVGQAGLIAKGDQAVDGQMAARVRAAIERRLRGEPPHRILGWREFHGLRLQLSPATLEPRPDTEALADMALTRARAAIERTGRCRLLDLGTGTGALALAVLAGAPEAQAVATDLSEAALRTAAANAERLGLAGRFGPLLSNWFAAVEGRFDLIVANPPYIASGEIAGLDIEVRGFDPPAALDGGPDGLAAYRAIAAGADPHLAKDGALCVEIGFGQRADVEAIFAASQYRVDAVARDLAGIDRALCFRRASSG